MKLFSKIKQKFTEAVLDDEKRYKTQYICTYFALGTVSLFMTIINIIDYETAKIGLLLATLLFAVLSYIDVALVYINELSYKISKILFTIEIVVLFSFFIISGSPEGFSATWLLLLPSLGLLLFGMKIGSIINGIILLILILLLRVPFFNQLFDVYPYYTESFKFRFPFAYIAFYVVGLLIESIRSITFENYKYTYSHDLLTSAINRVGFNEYVAAKTKDDLNQVIGFMMVDLDFFKKVNDTYGHTAGDEMLKHVSKIVEDNIDVPLCRWGGEEFVALFSKGNLSEEKANKIRLAVEKSPLIFEGHKIKMTISVGAVLVKKEVLLNNIIDVSNLADDCLYEAKETGKNKVIFKDYSNQEIIL